MTELLTQTKFRCGICGKISAGRQHRDESHPDAGSVTWPRRHTGPDGQPCPGNSQEAERISIPVRQGNRCRNCGTLFSLARKRCPNCKSSEFAAVESPAALEADLAGELPPAGQKPDSIAQAIAAFLKSIGDDRSKATQKAYRQGMQIFTRVLAQEKVSLASPPDLLSADLFAAMSQWLREKKIQADGDYSIASIRLYLTALSNFFEFLAAEEIAPVNLVKLKLLRRRRTPAQPQRLPHFPKEEIERLIGYAQNLATAPFAGQEERLRNLRDRALILTLADSGLRIHEACKLVRKDIDWREMRAIVIGKGNKQAVVRFTTRCLKALKEYLDARAVLDGSSGQRLDHIPLFLRHDHPIDAKRKKFQFRRMSTETGRNIVDQRVRECLGAEAVGSITPHSFRHYFVTVVLNATGNLKTAQELARHSRLETTGRYAHLSNTQLDQAYYDALENDAPE
jgi:site-specific recombinase XerD